MFPRPAHGGDELCPASVTAGGRAHSNRPPNRSRPSRRPSPCGDGRPAGRPPRRGARPRVRSGCRAATRGGRLITAANGNRSSGHGDGLGASRRSVGRREARLFSASCTARHDPAAAGRMAVKSAGSRAPGARIFPFTSHAHLSRTSRPGARGRRPDPAHLAGDPRRRCCSSRSWPRPTAGGMFSILRCQRRGGRALRMPPCGLPVPARRSARSSSGPCAEAGDTRLGGIARPWLRDCSADDALTLPRTHRESPLPAGQSCFVAAGVRARVAYDGFLPGRAAASLLRTGSAERHRLRPISRGRRAAGLGVGDEAVGLGGSRWSAASATAPRTRRRA